MPSRQKLLIVATICSIVMVSGAAAAANAALLSQVGESKQLPTGKLALPRSSPRTTVVDPSEASTDSSVRPVTTPAAVTTTTAAAVTSSVDPTASTLAELTDPPAGAPNVPGKSSAPTTPRNSSSVTSSPDQVNGSQVTAPPSKVPVATPVRGTSPATSTAPSASAVSTPSPTSPPASEPVASASPTSTPRQRPVSTPPTTKPRNTSTTHHEDDDEKEHPDD